MWDRSLPLSCVSDTPQLRITSQTNPPRNTFPPPRYYYFRIPTPDSFNGGLLLGLEVHIANRRLTEAFRPTRNCPSGLQRDSRERQRPRPMQRRNAARYFTVITDAVRISPTYPPCRAHRCVTPLSRLFPITGLKSRVTRITMSIKRRGQISQPLSFSAVLAVRSPSFTGTSHS